jgi:hypothetical protein
MFTLTVQELFQFIHFKENFAILINASDMKNFIFYREDMESINPLFILHNACSCETM